MAYFRIMKKFISFGIIFISIILFFAFTAPHIRFSFTDPFPSTQINCDINNDAFSSGEELVYQTYYNWGFIWLNVGEVTFKVVQSDYKGTPCYKLSGIGGTYPSYDWIYKVRNRFECWVDTSTLKPFRYIRDVNEGGKTFYNECFFNFPKMKAYCVTKEKNNVRLDTVAITSCTFDPLTMIYYSRNVDFSKCNVNDTVPISLFLNNKVYSLYMRYLGKEKLKLDDGTVFNCIKFSPKLVEGTIFKGGEGMTVWATDDKNKIPIYVEAPILVGMVKAKIIKWKGLKNKMEAKVEK